MKSDRAPWWDHTLRWGAPLLAILLCAFALPPSALAEGSAPAPRWVHDPAALVNPLIGTAPSCSRGSCRGLTVPGAFLPFGMVQWGPVTSSGGYNYSDSSMIGYALTSVSGCGGGCAAADNIPILPTSGAIGNNPSSASEPMNHAQETAAAGYYRLTAGGVTTQLTSAGVRQECRGWPIAGVASGSLEEVYPPD